MVNAEVSCCEPKGMFESTLLLLAVGTMAAHLSCFISKIMNLYVFRLFLLLNGSLSLFLCLCLYLYHVLSVLNMHQFIVFVKGHKLRESLLVSEIVMVIALSTALLQVVYTKVSCCQPMGVFERALIFFASESIEAQLISLVS